nr:NUDIX domain-containing protein [Oscillospiraceae bacterium]
MRFTYCPDCGSRLVPRPIGDEGLVPYCESCKKPLFELFSTCIIVMVVNEYEEVALLKQGYLSSVYWVLVSGYMKPGESAEECTRREVQEEIGLELEQLQIVGTDWFARREQLMIGFIARAKKREFTLSGEVEEARWVPVEEAPGLMHPGKSISAELVRRYLKGRGKA